MVYSDEVAIKKYFKEIEESNIIIVNKEIIKKFYREEKVKGIKESTLRSKIYICLRIALMFPNKKFAAMDKDGMKEKSSYNYAIYR